jgi:hypothetical protein
MDPVTALGIATTAFKVIKKTIELGKEIQGVNKELGQWYGAVADIRAGHYKTQGRFKNVEETALDTYLAMKEAADMEYQLKNMLTGKYGLGAWEDLQKIQAEIYKQRQLDAIKRQDQIKMYTEIGVSVVLVLLALGIIGWFGYMLLNFHQPRY